MPVVLAHSLKNVQACSGWHAVGRPACRGTGGFRTPSWQKGDLHVVAVERTFLHTRCLLPYLLNHISNGSTLPELILGRCSGALDNEWVQWKRPAFRTQPGAA